MRFTIRFPEALMFRAMYEGRLAEYPGETATPEQVRLLADEYCRAAHLLQQQGRAGEPISRAPFRLCAIHATELYLNAFLLHCGLTAADLRRMGHDVAARAERARAKGLVLRANTSAHLNQLVECREYLVTRYDTERSARPSHSNRMLATLDELARKVSNVLATGNVGAMAPVSDKVVCRSGERP